MPNNDNYTFISTRGNSVVDYCVILHDMLQTFEYFDVTPTNTLIDRFQLSSLISEHCKPPDHSLITTCVKFTHIPKSTQAVNKHVLTSIARKMSFPRDTIVITCPIHF